MPDSDKTLGVSLDARIERAVAEAKTRGDSLDARLERAMAQALLGDSLEARLERAVAQEIKGPRSLTPSSVQTVIKRLLPVGTRHLPGTERVHDSSLGFFPSRSSDTPFDRRSFLKKLQIVLGFIIAARGRGVRVLAHNDKAPTYDLEDAILLEVNKALAPVPGVESEGAMPATDPATEGETSVGSSR